MGWARKIECVPALMVRDPAVERMKGLAFDPILPAALRVREPVVIVAEVRVVVIAPVAEVRMRLVVGRLIGEVIFISPVVWVRERSPAVIVSER